MRSFNVERVGITDSIGPPAAGEMDQNRVLGAGVYCDIIVCSIISLRGH